VKRWLGRWLLGVGIIHTGFGLIVFWREVGSLWRSGLWDALAGYQERELGFWFIVSGWLMILAGGLLDTLEAHGAALPFWFGWALLALVVVGVVLMPVSGFWLLLPPTLGVLRRTSRRKAARAAA
jgi:hypothetical protein